MSYFFKIAQKGKRPHFRLTCAAQKRLCLSSLLLASTSSLLKLLIGDFKIRRRDGNENVKKQQVNFISETTTFHVHHSFLYISLPFLHDYDVKCLIFAFYGKRKQATRKFYFSFCIMNLISLGSQLQEGSSTFEK